MANLHPAIRETLAAHEGLRMLGFLADDIYVMLKEGVYTKDIYTAVILKTQGKEFYILTGIWNDTIDEFEMAWEEAVYLWNNKLTKPEMDAIWFGSLTQSSPFELVRAIMKKKIVIPMHLQLYGYKKDNN